MIEYKQPRDLETTAGILTISVDSVKELIRLGKLTAYRVGPKKGIRIPQSEIDRHIRESVIMPGDL